MRTHFENVDIGDLAKAGHLSVLASGTTTDWERWYAVKVMDAWCIRIGPEFEDEVAIIQKGGTLPKDQVQDFVSASEQAMEIYAEIVHPYNLSH